MNAEPEDEEGVPSISHLLTKMSAERWGIGDVEWIFEWGLRAPEAEKLSPEELRQFAREKRAKRQARKAGRSRNGVTNPAP